MHRKSKSHFGKSQKIQALIEQISSLLLNINMNIFPLENYLVENKKRMSNFHYQRIHISFMYLKQSYENLRNVFLDRIVDPKSDVSLIYIKEYLSCMYTKKIDRLFNLIRHHSTVLVR